MRIAIPVDEKDIGTNVCESFGRTPYYLIMTQAKKVNLLIIVQQQVQVVQGLGLHK